MNVQLKDITVTARDGRVSHLDQVYIRGSHVRFFIVPDMLRYAPPPALVYGLRLARQQGKTEGRWMLICDTGTHLCSAREASAAEVLDWRVVRRRCRGLGDSGGVDFCPWDLVFSFLSRFTTTFSM